jgi:hypothetical protein
MKSTLEAILSDVQVREVNVIEAHLSEELSAGIPWYDET